ncbi:signal transduction histidine kinase [Aureibacter tunicatorum]|uniref:histidine kinase n=1 Tax=Aureibacter tunicatorum TaxID=866807 RepID=A0AAE3XSZ9_9BACT|nr:signal transduction histidine kinase [Aureibacter tunicatorum]
MSWKRTIANQIAIIGIAFIIQCFFFSLSYSQIIGLHFDTKTGFPHNTAYNLHIDSLGNIYTGTNAGLSIFNGLTFKTINTQHGLRNHVVVDIAQNKAGDINISTWGGGVMQLKNDSVYDDKIEKNNLCYASKLRALDSGFFYRQSLGNFGINYSCENSSTNKYDEFFIWKDSLKKTAKAKIGPKAPYIQDVNFSCFNERLFFHQGFWGNRERFTGVHLLNSNKQISTPYSFLNNSQIHMIDTCAVHQCLKASSFGNVYHFNQSGIISQDSFLNDHFIIRKHLCRETFQSFNTFNLKNQGFDVYLKFPDSPSPTNLMQKHSINHRVSDIELDSNENLWISLFGGGMRLLPSGLIKTQIDYLFQDKNILDISLANDSIVYLLEDNHIIHKANQQEVIYSTTLKDNITALHFIKSKDKVYADVSIRNYNPNKNSNIISGQKSMYFSQDSSFTFKVLGNYLWYTYAKDTFQFSFKEIHLNIKHVVTSQDKIWIATNNGLHAIKKFSHQPIFHLNEENGKISNNVLCLQEINNNIWAGTMRGIAIISKDGKLQKTINKDSGLDNEHINKIHKDRYGKVWVLTQKGVSLINSSNIFNLNSDYGLPLEKITDLEESNNGNIWLAGGKGVVVLKNNNADLFNEINKLHITKSGLRYKFAPVAIPASSNYMLHYKINNGGWQNLQSMSLDFTDYKQGKYRLELRAKNFSQWKYFPVQKFEVVYPWYQQPWLFIILLCVTFGLVTFWILKKLTSLKKKHELLLRTLSENKTLQKELVNVRETAASDFHDAMGNKLAGITVLSEMLLRDAEKGRLNNQRVIRIKEDAKGLYDGMKDVIWAMKSSSDELWELAVYLIDFGEKMFQGTDIQFYSQQNIDDKGARLPIGWNKQILLIFKEAMTNSLKYSEADTIALNLVLDRKRLMISLIDNGIGFDMNAIDRINGISNMRNRAQTIGVELEIHSQKGTHIIMTANIL